MSPWLRSKGRWAIELMTSICSLNPKSAADEKNRVSATVDRGDSSRSKLWRQAIEVLRGKRKAE